MTTAALVGRVVSAAALSALAAWSFRPVFDAGAGLAVLSAVTIPVVVAAVWELVSSQVLRRPGGSLASVLGVLWVLVAVAAVTRPGGDVLSGPFRLLTGVLPMEAAAPQLAAVALVAGLASVVAVNLATRPTGALLPVVPALVCLGAGLSLSAGAGAPPAWYVPVFVGLSTLPALVGPAVVTRARPVKGAVVVLAAVAAGLAFVQWGPQPSRPPASAQDLVSAPVRAREGTNPMAQFLALREGRLLLEVTGTASGPVDRIGMVTLTDFDGRAWSPDADYRRAAHQLPAPTGATASRREVTLDLRVATPDSIGWLPRPGWPTSVSVSGLGFDEGTGDLAVPAGERTPSQYRITAGEPVVPPEVLRADRPARGPGRSGPALSPEVLAFLDKITTSHTTDLDRLLGLAETLKNFPFQHDGSDEAPGGNGLHQVYALLRGHQGTSEQYASAFAVLCRELGWDARVVLGFTPQWDGDRLRISGRDVHAWAEVRFERAGWLPVDPTPRQDVDGKQPPAEPDESPGEVDSGLPPPHQPQPAPDPDTSSADDPGVVPDDSSQAGPLLVLLGATVVLLLLLSLPVANAVRMRRASRRGSARSRVVAAWRESVAVLRAGGADVHEHQTTGQVVGAVADHHRPALWSLAELVDRAAFGPDQVSDEMAAAAALLSVRVRDQVGLNAGRRLLRRFDPRPLLPRRPSAEYADITGRRAP
ncbi:DUF4129 domain-containing transglutaminase family protein [Saccharothrix sp. Mg75]|uniref:DUF4129 domain-containing transglutaminase family protein n=1 Tax=Saccharothrix sp. Mg75 TaxID=3445357 RepID=UPI003EEDE401